MTVAAVLDLETTGTAPEDGDRIVEVAVTWVADDPASKTSVEFIFNPGRSIPPEASAVHHLTDAHVAEAPPVPQAAEWVELFASSDYLVAHNAQFDRSFLPPLSRPWICTWRVSLHLWPDAPGHGLQVLRYWRGLQPAIAPGTAPHRAAYDVACCVSLLEDQLRVVGERNGCATNRQETWREMIELSSRPVLLRKVSFGKHRGSLWQDLPKDYLRWILSKDFDEDVRHTASYYLGR